MYTLAPAQVASRKRNYFGYVVFALLLALGIAAISYATSPARNPVNHVSPAVETSAAVKVLAAQRAIAAQVNLRAKEWNNGYVHLWTDINEASAAHIDVPESASCIRMDDHTYKVGSGSTALFYYKLICNGVVGYVERDQVH